MKISQGIFVVFCIVFTIHQLSLVECDQALGTRINGMNLNTIANRDRLLSGSNTGGITNPAASFQIWIKGIQLADFNAVVGAINGAGCTLISSNINNNAKGLPHWNYVIARIRCNTQQKWQNLVYNQAFYSRVAFSERSYSTDNAPPTGTSSASCLKRFTQPPRIALWQGKVNQHTNPAGVFATDPDGTSGAQLDKLTYCKKWYSQTTGFRDYQQETITGFRDAGNTGGPYTRTLMTIECIQPAGSCKRDVKDIDFNDIQQPTESEIEHFREVHANMLRSIEEYKNYTVELENQKKQQVLCPEPYIQRENIEAAESEEDKNALRRIYQECPVYPPPYYPPPPPPPPPSDFVCSQVNEGGNAVLTCPSGKVIKKIEFASYGNSPALGACAAFPNPKQGSCHSYGSEYRVHQRCCGQSSCTVPATNSFFVEPCTGVAKTLRIKAVCDYSSKTECTMPICNTWTENAVVNLNCPSGLTIRSIDFISWGSSPTLHCENGFAINGNCYANTAATKNKAESFCKGRQSCSFTANNANFGDPCPGSVKYLALKASCANHEPYISGFEQSTSMQPNFNYAWESSNGRPWTNYLENMGWTSSVDYYNSLNGGTFYLLDLGVNENHPELMDYNVNPAVTRVKRLPNVMNPDVTKQNNGFIDPDLLLETGEDPHHEEYSSHGTTNAAILIGNTLGLARNVPLYHAKVASGMIGLDNQAFANALATINQLSGTTNHKRPSVVMAPFTLNFGYGYCYASRVNSFPPEPTCSQGIMDELATAYEKGIIVVLPSNNGYNFFDLKYNPHTGAPFEMDATVPYPRVSICDREPLSAVPINICNSARRHHDMSFNVWDLYMPVLEKTTQKPFVVAGHDSYNRISRYRDIVYSTSDVWDEPWWSIGSSNLGTCVDFSSFGVRFSKTAANAYAIEDSHYFTSGYRMNPYYMSGTSFATATAGAVTMYAYGRYGTGSFNGNAIETVRSRMKSNGNRNYDDIDTCRNNYWDNNADATSYPRLKFW